MTDQKDGRTLGERLIELFGTDNGHDIARELARHGIRVSPQNVYNWLGRKTGMREELAQRIARLKNVSPLWLRSGIGPKRQFSNGEMAFAALVNELPHECREETLNFIEGMIHRPSVLLTGETISHYMTFIDKVRLDMNKKKGGSE